MKQNIGFRAWFYFRAGWTTYFAFIFAAINTLTVTYFLAIENYPSLNNIFPNEGFTKADTIFNIVVFPHSDGPKIAYLFPSSQVIENGFNA